MERYCSSFYDRNGLYNDGFPCPKNKYCCQNQEGNKICCSESIHSNEYAQNPTSTVLSYLASSSTKSIHILHEQKVLGKNKIIQSRIHNINKQYLSSSLYNSSSVSSFITSK